VFFRVNKHHEASQSGDVRRTGLGTRNQLPQLDAGDAASAPNCHPRRTASPKRRHRPVRATPRVGSESVMTRDSDQTATKKQVCLWPITPQKHDIAKRFQELGMVRPALLEGRYGNSATRS